MEEESRQKTDRKRMLGLLTVSCAATLCFAGLYVQELKTVEKLESAGQWTDTEELNALRADYSDIQSGVGRAGTGRTYTGQ